MQKHKGISQHDIGDTKRFYGDSKLSDVSVYADMNPEITV